jgi:hypothetical protein
MSTGDNFKHALPYLYCFYIKGNNVGTILKRINKKAL